MIITAPRFSRNASTWSSRSSVIFSRCAVLEQPLAARACGRARRTSGRRATQQAQTIAISASSEISPWPATRPPTITAVSPGATKPRNAPVSRNASSADGEVGPLAERLARVLEQLLEVRQLDHADADQDGGGDRDQLGRLEPALLLVAAGDQPAGEHDRRREPGELHAATARG